MRLLQFAIPQRVGQVCAEAVTRLAGGATLLPGLGWWVNGKEVEREEVSWLIVGTEDGKVEEVVDAVKSILKSAGESAIFYTVGTEPRIEWL
jgi:hypothetical protein